jgi:predicted dehydrogenase
MTALRWAAVGTGTISRSVVPDLMSCAGAEVTVVHSRDADKAARFGQEHGIARSTGDLEAVLADDTVDAVYLATPFATHHEMTRAALLAGKHVLVEKPLAMTAAEAADLFAVAAAQGRFLMEAMWMKFNPAFRRLHREIADGTIGEPRNLRAGFAIPFPDDGGSRWDPARSGGALLDQGIYPVTLAHSIFGAPRSVVAAGTVRPDGLDLDQHVTLEYSEGRFAQLMVSMTEFGDCSAAVGGPRGWLTLTPPFWATTDVEIHAGSFRAIFRTPQLVEHQREGNGYVPMLREVISAIRDGAMEHPVHPADATVEVFTTLDRIRAQLLGAGLEQAP